jgi:hypothetical protein
VWPSVKHVRGYDEINATIAGFERLCRKRRNVEGITGALKMWVFVLLLNLLGRKNFMRFLGAWMLIMMFILYCFVHDAFNQPMRPMMVQQMQRRPVNPTPVSAPER